MNNTGFLDLKKRAENFPKRRVAVAAAGDEEVIRTAAEAEKAGIADFILVGDQARVRELAQEAGLKVGDEGAAVIHEPDDTAAALLAAELVRNGEADVLMKGLVNSSIFLKAVLDEKRGLRGEKTLSHFAAFEIPGQPKLAFYTDGGMNPFPDYGMKKQILINGLEALHKLGIDEPKTAVLTANETVTPKMPSTVDAAELVEAWKRGELPPCILEGPMALDVALSREAAAHKGIESQISGDTDLFLVPNIEAGNLIGKSLIYYAGAKMAGVILGGRRPIVMTSRSENAEGKLNSILLACLL